MDHQRSSTSRIAPANGFDSKRIHPLGNRSVADDSFWLQTEFPRFRSGAWQCPSGIGPVPGHGRGLVSGFIFIFDPTRHGPGVSADLSGNEQRGNQSGVSVANLHRLRTDLLNVFLYGGVHLSRVHVAWPGKAFRRLRRAYSDDSLHDLAPAKTDTGANGHASMGIHGGRTGSAHPLNMVSLCGPLAGKRDHGHLDSSSSRRNKLLKFAERTITHSVIR